MKPVFLQMLLYVFRLARNSVIVKYAIVEHNVGRCSASEVYLMYSEKYRFLYQICLIQWAMSTTVFL
jgi:hypothetical protein